MVNFDSLYVYAFSDYLAGIVVAVHMVNNLDRGNEPENEGYESKDP